MATNSTWPGHSGKTLAAAILAAVVTGCATPQHSQAFAEGLTPGRQQIEDAKTDAYTQFMRAWTKVHDWLVLRW